MKNILSLLLIVLSNGMNAQDIVRIAAHNSTEQAKACADYVCTGKNDETTIQRGVWEHPITLINCAEEHCASLPLFNHCGAAWKMNQRGYQVIDMISHTIEYRDKENPTLAPILPAREIVPGTWCGNISFCGNVNASSLENAVDVPFWEKGSGQRFFTRNSAHALAGTSKERLSYLPMYMQQFFDTDLNKLLIYNGDRWVDTNGNEQ